MYAINGTYVGVSVGEKLSSHCFNFKFSSSPSLYIKQHPTLMTWYNAAKGKCEGLCMVTTGFGMQKSRK